MLFQEHLLKITSEHRAEMAMKRGKLNLPEEGWYFVMWLSLPIEFFPFTCSSCGAIINAQVHLGKDINCWRERFI